jgi:hypothetical protein
VSFNVTSTPPPTGPVPVGIPGTWTLKASDEFNGTALNTGLWEPLWYRTSGPVAGLENNCYSSANSVLGNGVLSETLRAQSCTDKNGASHPYTGAIVDSSPASHSPGYQFLYGVAEARLYLPNTATGQVNDWPGWWVANEYNGTYPEIDIFEAGGDGVSTGTGTYHVHMPTGNPGGT